MSNETTKPVLATAPKLNIAKNSFARSAAEIRRGGFITEASEKLAELTEAVMKTGKVGSLTITLKMRRNGDGASVEITDNVKATIPKKDTPSTNFYVGDNNELLRDHPKQSEMFNVVDVEEVKAAPIQMAETNVQAIPLTQPGAGGQAFPLQSVAAG